MHQQSRHLDEAAPFPGFSFKEELACKSEEFSAAGASSYNTLRPGSFSDQNN